MDIQSTIVLQQNHPYGAAQKQLKHTHSQSADLLQGKIGVAKDGAVFKFPNL